MEIKLKVSPLMLTERTANRGHGNEEGRVSPAQVLQIVPISAADAANAVPAIKPSKLAEIPAHNLRCKSTKSAG